MTQPDQPPQQPHVVVIGPDGQPIGTTPAPDGDAQSAMLAAGEGREGRGAGNVGEQLGEMVSEPAKVMRIGSMIKQLLDEVRAAPLDDASRNRLRQVHERSIHELEDGLSTELRDELHRLSLPFGDDVTPSDAELRIAQAQLVGWLEGLFHGIQTALFAQQMAARVQVEEMRRKALPSGSSMGMPGQPAGAPGMPGYPASGDQPGSGQYL
ncbi:MAG: bacterial proteasome activator family protein [Geodermatophilaceae bacterium]|nr:bacterial proteasome activator family protein [Geodermatophilaceae bacterium]